MTPNPASDIVTNEIVTNPDGSVTVRPIDRVQTPIHTPPAGRRRTVIPVAEAMQRFPRGSSGPAEPAPSNSEHARLSPSASHRWLACPASIVLHEQLRAQPGYREPPDGDASIAGRRMHAVAEAILVGRPGAGLSNEESQLVRTYVNHIQSIRNLLTYDMNGMEHSVWNEERLNTGIPDVWGTCDYAIWCQESNEVWVIDLKTGHQRVSPVENTQLGIYALGVALLLGDAVNTSTVFHLQIVQPRDEEEPIKSWTTGMGWLDSLWHRVNQARNDLPDIDNGLADPAPSPGDHCTFCPAAANCPAVRDRALSVFDSQSSEQAVNEDIRRTVVQTPQHADFLTVARAADLSAAQVAFFLRYTDRITEFLDACRARALNEEIPGYKVVAANSRRRWSDEERVVFELQNANRDDLIRRRPPTIGEAERVLGRNNPIIATYAVAPPGSPTVVPESDPRPALDRSAVFRVERAEPMERF